MSRYIATSVPPRSGLAPKSDGEHSPASALLQESERQTLRSYRPPTLVGGRCDSYPTIRWTAEEREALLALARATVDADDTLSDSREESAAVLPPSKDGRRAG